jgi:fibronectin-binding autotransporter adhesin
MLCILPTTLLSGVAQGQVNSWTSAAGGKWEESANWSLGVVPSVNDTADLITNAGGEIATVDATTVLSNALNGCMSISNLTVSSPNSATNTLFLKNAGLTSPLSVLDIMDIDTNGAVVVNGSVLQVSSALFVGEYGYNGTLTITNGGQVYSGSGYVAYDSSYNRISSNNVATVTGSGSVWSNSGDLSIGIPYTTENSLIVANGGAVSDATGYLSGNGNTILVIGEGSVWNNSGDLHVGYAGSFNTLTIANGGLVYDNDGFVEDLGHNSVLVTGIGSVWSNRDEISIEAGSGCCASLTISNGGVVYSSSADVDGDENDFALVTGTGSIWNVSGVLDIGGYSPSLIISAGGVVDSGGGQVGMGSYVQVAGSGSLWSINGTLDIEETLTISNEGAVFADSVSMNGAVVNVLGGGLYATNGVSMNGAVVNVSGGGLYATNGLGTAVLAVNAAELTLNGGAVTVDQFQMVTPTDYSFFTFTSGLLTSASTSVSNGQNFAVGDGTNGATFQLASGGSGVHSFANGLTVSSNAFLTGCGTVEGSVVDNPGGTIVANCGGTLTFTGIVTNNGTMQALNGSVLEAYGLVVNNGIIDIRAGTTNFHGGFINNGIVITTNNFPVITAIQAVGPDVKIAVKTGNGSTYLFEETTNLTTGTWTPIIEFYGTGGIINFIDPGATALPQRFYRVGLVP